MKADEIKPGDQLWYFYRIPGSVLRGQEQVQVHAVKGDSVQVTRRGRRVWVKAQNLRPTN